MLTSITIPDGVTSIGDSAFENCTSLQFNRYDNGLYLGNETNKYLVLIKPRMQGIKNLAINSKCKIIIGGAFSGCNSLTSVTIPDSVMCIGGRAFLNCSSLTNITIPDSVTSIGISAFWGCTSLTSANIPSSVTSIGSGAFRGCTSLNYNEYDNACYLGNDNNPYFVLIKAKSKGIIDCNISEKCKFICDCAFNGCSKLTSITIGDSVTSIGDLAFSGCSSLTSITIGNSVTSIGNSAFYDCSSLTNVTIGNSVTSIGYDAFSGCTSLSRIYYNGDINGWVQIDRLSDLMSYGSSDKELYINGELLTEAVIDTATEIKRGAFRGCSSLTSITIGNSVTSIGDSAFENCTSLTNVTIGDSVTSIGGYAFEGCRSLKTINYKGSKEQWNSISKGSYWNFNTGSYTINYNYVEN